MNIQRKIVLQEERLKSMQAQINNLENENAVLRLRNKELSNKEAICKKQIEAAKKLYVEYECRLAEVTQIKESYQRVVTDAQNMKKEYSRKFKNLMGRMKSQNKKGVDAACML